MSVKIFIAGPMYTQGRLCDHTRATFLAAQDLIAEGLWPFVPHLNFGLATFADADEGYWRRWSKAWLTSCDAILRLPGESPGADEEWALARALGMPRYGDTFSVIRAYRSGRLKNRLVSVSSMRTPLTFERLQHEHAIWSAHNFPESTKDHAFKGMVEEMGELAHALLKWEQGIRGSAGDHEAEAMDAIGDLIVFLSDLCTKYSWSLQEVIEVTWAQVQERDWIKYPETGLPPTLEKLCSEALPDDAGEV